MTCSMTTISVDGGDGGGGGIITLYTHCYDEETKEFRENSLACDLLPLLVRSYKY